MKKYLSKIKLLDLYPKTIEEAKEKSTAGAIVSLVGFLVLLYLAISEISDYWSMKKDNTLMVYTSRDERLSINFRITFFELPCEAVNVDVMDKNGEEMLSTVDIGQNLHIVKQPWRGDFKQIKSELFTGNGMFDLWPNAYSKELKLWNALWKKVLPKPESRPCLPCYEAATRSGKPNMCCNNCYQLKQAYAMNYLPISDAMKQPQCLETPTEGCLVSGYARVQKVQGGFHIAVGQSHVEEGQRHHHHWEAPLRQLGFNSTHYIHHFSFGAEYPGMVNPLDSTMYVEKGVGQQQYFMQVVPTTYVKSNGVTVTTNQYSVTESYSPVDINAERIELPGLFFKYDISPIMIKLQERYVSFAHLFTRVFAVIGGVWVVLGMVYKSFKTVVDKLIKVTDSL